jgi:hypothetical protein
MTAPAFTACPIKPEPKRFILSFPFEYDVPVRGISSARGGLVLWQSVWFKGYPNTFCLLRSFGYGRDKLRQAHFLLAK